VVGIVGEFTISPQKQSSPLVGTAHTLIWTPGAIRQFNTSTIPVDWHGEGNATELATRKGFSSASMPRHRCSPSENSSQTGVQYPAGSLVALSNMKRECYCIGEYRFSVSTRAHDLLSPQDSSRYGDIPTPKRFFPARMNSRRLSLQPAIQTCLGRRVRFIRNTMCPLFRSSAFLVIFCSAGKR
jgi:hypothetical protein